MKKIGFIVLIIFLAGCVRSKVQTNAPMQLLDARIGVSPLANNSITPLAGYRAATMIAAILQARGVRSVSLYRNFPSCARLLNCPKGNVSLAQAKAWARRRHLNYLITGSVNEWGYKVGLDGEPAAGVTINVISMRSGAVVWSGAGSRSGGSRTGLNVNAHILLDKMLNPLTGYYAKR